MLACGLVNIVGQVLLSFVAVLVAMIRLFRAREQLPSPSEERSDCDYRSNSERSGFACRGQFFFVLQLQRNEVLLVRKIGQGEGSSHATIFVKINSHAGYCISCIIVYLVCLTLLCLPPPRCIHAFCIRKNKCLVVR